MAKLIHILFSRYGVFQRPPSSAQKSITEGTKILVRVTPYCDVSKTVIIGKRRIIYINYSISGYCSVLLGLNTGTLINLNFGKLAITRLPTYKHNHCLFLGPCALYCKFLNYGSNKG